MRTSYFDGKHLKGFNIPVSWDSDIGWDVYGKDVQGDELYGKVAAVYRAVNLNAEALASLPFALVQAKTGEDFDTSEDWQNKIGFLPNPKKMIGLWRKSLAMTNTAYGKFEREKREIRLRYIVPTTMQPDVDKERGLLGWWRQVGGRRDYFPKSRGDIVWVYRMDYDTEILPSKNTEFLALMASAGIMYYSDYFVEEFFMRGGIKPHVMFLKGVVNPDEKKRIESRWERFLKGLEGMFKVAQADLVEAVPVGPGVDDFKDNTFYLQALENVAIASGIPLSIIKANSANKATATVEYRAWYDNKIVPDAKFMADELNENLFSRFDLRLEFRPEQSAPDQEEEVQKAQAFSTYATVFQKNGHPEAISLAAQIVGIDLPADMEFDELDKRDESRIQQDQGVFPEVEKAKEKQKEQEKKPERKGFAPDAEQLNELATWQDIATRKIKKGLKLELPLVSKTLPVDIAGMINERLEGVTTITEVKAAFDLSAMTMTEPPPPAPLNDIMYLANAINRLAESKE